VELGAGVGECLADAVGLGYASHTEYVAVH
jgi:hypothetical protein